MISTVIVVIVVVVLTPSTSLAPATVTSSSLPCIFLVDMLLLLSLIQRIKNENVITKNYWVKRKKNHRLI